MRKKCLILITVALFVVVLPRLTIAGITNVDDLQKLTEKNLKSAKIVSSDFVQTIKMDDILGPQGKMTFVGKMFYLIPDKMRINYKMTIMGSDIDITVINDGKMMWTEKKFGDVQQVMKIDMNEIKNMEAFNTFSGTKPDNKSFEQIYYPIKTLKESHTIKLLGKEKIDDEEMLAVDAVMTDEVIQKLNNLGQIGNISKSLSNHQKFYFDPKTGFVKKMVCLGDDNQEIVSWVFSNHVVDPKVEKDFFIFTPPDNIKIIDMTPMIKSMLETMSKPVQEPEADKTKTEPQTEKTEDKKKTEAPAEKPDKTTEEQKQLPEKETKTTPEES